MIANDENTPLDSQKSGPIKHLGLVMGRGLKSVANASDLMCQTTLKQIGIHFLPLRHRLLMTYVFDFDFVWGQRQFQ